MIIIPKKLDAIRALVGGGVSGPTDGSNTVFHRGQTPPTEKEIEDKLKELQAEYDAKQYQRDRQYPPIGDQLDLQYWDKVNGTSKWQESISKVKSDHPKPSE